MKKPTEGKHFLDTNVLVYAFGEHDVRREPARKLLAEGCVVGVQNLNEFAAIATRKIRMGWEEILEALGAILVLCGPPIALTLDIHTNALKIAQRHDYHIFDLLIIAAAVEAGCRTLYSEDLCHGQVIQGLTICNPFKHLRVG